MRTLVILNESCRYFEPVLGLLIGRTNESIAAGSTVWIRDREVKFYDHQHKWAIPFEDDTGKILFFLEEELDYEFIPDQGPQNFIAPSISSFVN